jgi:PAS domain S-box-containing protein
MTEAKVGRDKNATQAARLVWLLVLLGLGAGGFSLCVVRRALTNIREQKVRLVRTQDAIDDLATEVTRGFAEAQSEIEQLLAAQLGPGKSSDWIEQITRSLDKFSASMQISEVAPGLSEMKAFLADMKTLRGECAEWNKKYKDRLLKLAERKNAADTELRSMRAALSSADGRQRLELAARIRRFYKLSGKPAEDAAGQIIAGLGSGDPPVEVAHLALLCERLVGDNEIDYLADMEDNFSASLLRLSQIVSRSGDVHSPLRPEMDRSLAALKQAVFGTGYVMDSDHQTIRSGADGLSSLCRQRLELRQQRETLRVQMARRLSQCKAAHDRLDALSDAIKNRITSQVEGSLVNCRRNLWVISLACASLLVLLGRTIARTLKRQISVIEEATSDLRRSNAQMAAIHQTSLDCVLVLDNQWQILEINPAAERTFNCRYYDAICRSFADFIVAPQSSEAGGFVPGPENTVFGKQIEVTAKRPDKSTFPAELAITAAKADGPPIYVVSLRDLTERKKAEAEREELNTRLLTVSRHAGMAEVATGVLHNVGNVLNSVNVSASVVAEKLRHSELASLAKVGEMISGHKHDLTAFLTADDRGKLLPDFIIDLARCLGEEQIVMLAEVSALAKGIEHIKQIVLAQQSLAKKTDVDVPVEPVKLMETALTMQSGALANEQIEIVRRFEDVGSVMLDQHRILQILVNLISNAKHAVKRSGNVPKRITLVVETSGEGGERRLRLQVMDSGIGIAPTNLTRIFSHGFTTKQDGHGFGLHSAANAAKTMGGSLTAASDGPGCGAVFTLEFPLIANKTGEACKR